MKKWLRIGGPILGLIFVFALFAILRRETFCTWDNAEIMLIQGAVVGMATLGMTMIIITGGIDLSAGSSVALGTVVVALSLVHGFSPTMAMGIGVLAGLLIGCAMGGMISFLKMPPFIVTLGLWGALRGVAKGLAREQMVNVDETWLNSLLSGLEEHQKWRLLPSGVWAVLVLALIVWFMLARTRFGRHVYAVGSNEKAARLCGIHVSLVKLAVYGLAGVFFALAGVLQFSYLTQGDPTTATGLELDVIAAVVIGGGSLSGGAGSVWGSLLGTLIMVMVANGCVQMGFPNWVQEIVTGGIILLAVGLDMLRGKQK